MPAPLLYRHPGLDPGSSGATSAALDMFISRKDLRGWTPARGPV